ncbi:acyl-CoA/acyl-ACP dehydrogenase [Arthrobacter crystallopoietes]|uniref:acyl-CoA/acyl-ACP dehydrogenase n=1 Tax=Crystallibacter crystallopoietes TaxID=37928 RepID=UPI001ABDB302|nr:acyl-CoA/acyl-ACP dehydrogenase [Arthrobacter crystallopoietes]QTG82515.1 acyl-CoA/acyl-ACP dehydrogenase [Arthrobacter crystallopoietes]
MHTLAAEQISFGARPASQLDWGAAGPLLARAGTCKGDPRPILAELRAAQDQVPQPGTGATRALWEFLAGLATVDLAAARTVEPHLDAAAILAQAGMDMPPGSAWGVFAAESAGNRLEATKDDDGAWHLSGTKPWCSLAAELDAAVVTAHVPGGRRAFAVGLRRDEVQPDAGDWPSLGLSSLPSTPVYFRASPAVPVGETDWYLSRPGFAWGGMGVAACWFGGAVGLFRTMLAAAHRREPDQLAFAWLGEADRSLAAGASVLGAAADQVDAGQAGAAEALRVRGHIAALCTRILEICGQSLGPGPLAFDADHARRAADLTLYIRQHHAARDDAALGRLLFERASPSASELAW